MEDKYPISYIPELTPKFLAGMKYFKDRKTIIMIVAGLLLMSFFLKR